MTRSRTLLPKALPGCSHGPELARHHAAVLEAALRYRNLGYRVLPVDPSTKRPWIPWKQYQKEDPSEDDVRSWFRERPDSGVGISTDGLVGMDDDDKAGGYSYSARLLAEDDNHPVELTPRGGRHHLYRQPDSEDIASSAGKLALGVDVRARGGFLVIAPTVRSDGGAYKWLDGRELDCPPESLPLPPDWLLAELHRVGRDSKPRLSQTKAGGRDVDIIRNVNYTSEAGYLRRIGASREAIEAYLLARNDESSDPLGTDEIHKIAVSVAKYAPDDAAYQSVGGLWRRTGLGSPQGLESTSSPPPITVLSLMDLESRSATVELFPGIVPDKSLIFVNSQPAIGKSLLLEAMAYSVALGTPLMGTGPTPTRTGWVLLLLPEGANSWGARSKAFRFHYRIDPTDQIAGITVGADFSSPARIEELVAAINGEISRRGGILPTLIILDTLSASIPGIDENQQAAMTLVCGALQSWANSGVAVVVAHHLRKDGTRVRGSSVIEGAVERSMTITRSGNTRKVRADKIRDGVAQNFAFDVVDVDGLPVPVMGTSPTMDFIIGTAEKGLIQAIRSCGFNDAGGPPTGRFTTGINVNAVAAAWNKLDPIQPPRAEDRKSYDKERNRRKSATLDLMRDLLDSLDIKMIKGSLHRSSRADQLNALFVQAAGDDDD